MTQIIMLSNASVTIGAIDFPSQGEWRKDLVILISVIDWRFSQSTQLYTPCTACKINFW